MFRNSMQLNVRDSSPEVNNTAVLSPAGTTVDRGG